MANALDALILRVGNQDEHSALPVYVFTGTGAAPRPRLRVHQSQTSFWEGAPQDSQVVLSGPEWSLA